MADLKQASLPLVGARHGGYGPDERRTRPANACLAAAVVHVPKNPAGRDWRAHESRVLEIVLVLVGLATRKRTRVPAGARQLIPCPAAMGSLIKKRRKRMRKKKHKKLLKKTRWQRRQQGK